MSSLNMPGDNSSAELLLQSLTEEKSRRLVENKLFYYQAYPKQKAFHDAGALHRERLFMAGNRVGKTMCGAAELAYHLTGEYPPLVEG